MKYVTSIKDYKGMKLGFGKKEKNRWKFRFYRWTSMNVWNKTC